MIPRTQQAAEAMKMAALTAIGLLALGWLGWTAWFGDGFQPWRERSGVVATRQEVASRAGFVDYLIQVEVAGPKGGQVRSEPLPVRVTRALGGGEQPPGYWTGERVMVYQHRRHETRLSLAPRGVNLFAQRDGAQPSWSLRDVILLLWLLLAGIAALAWLFSLLRLLLHWLRFRRA